MKTLILASHPDDALLSVGGTIAKLGNVDVVIFSWKEQGFKEPEIRDAYLGIREVLLDFSVRRFNEHRQDILDYMIKLEKPDLVITHSSFDNHQDHKVIREEAWRAFKDVNLLGFEQEWNHIKFDSRFFVKLEKQHIDNKLKALGCLNQNRSYHDPELIFSKARERGSYINTKYAEAFELIRWIL